MTKYIITSPKIDGQIEMLYDQSQYCIFYNCDAQLSDTQYMWWAANFPFTVIALHDLARNATGFTIVEVATPVTFDDFWEAYQNKEGSKIKAEGIWQKLNVGERIAAIRYIVRYDKYLKAKGTAKALPSTYLHGKYWVK